MAMAAGPMTPMPPTSKAASTAHPAHSSTHRLSTRRPLAATAAVSTVIAVTGTVIGAVSVSVGGATIGVVAVGVVAVGVIADFDRGDGGGGSRRASDGTRGSATSDATRERAPRGES